MWIKLNPRFKSPLHPLLAGSCPFFLCVLSIKNEQRTQIDIFPKTYKWPTVHERHLISLIVRKMQIKPTMRCHLTAFRMAVTKNTGDSRCQDEEKREPCTVGRNVNWCSYCGKQHRGFSRIKNRTTIRSSSPVLGVCVSKSSGVRVLKLQLHSCAAVFIAAVFSRACWGTA